MNVQLLKEEIADVREKLAREKKTRLVPEVLCLVVCDL